MSTRSLKLTGLKVARDGQETVKGIDLEVPAGQIHILMGPNGSGKSSLANALMGHPDCQITGGRFSLDGRSLLKMGPDERALAGLFLAPQTSPDIEGVGLSSVLRTAVNAHLPKSLDAIEFRDRLLDALAEVGLPASFADRNLNQGFSGGERKRGELVQMVLLRPKYAILDEIDSGLDVDGLKTVAETMRAISRAGTGILLITHYERLLKLVRPNRVHVLADGRLVKSGGPALAERISQLGFKKFVAGVKRV